MCGKDIFEQSCETIVTDIGESMSKWCFGLYKAIMHPIFSIGTILIINSVIFFTQMNFWSFTTIDEHVSLTVFTTHIDKKIPILMNEYNVPGLNISIVKEGKIVWSQAYGYADREKNRKMTVNTVCRVESISKPVTAWGLMRLLEQGLVDLDRPITHYIKKWRFPQSAYSIERVTVRMLLSHTSGMPLGTIGELYNPGGEVPSLRDRLSRDAVLIREPGSEFSYSNTGFNLIELLIEEVTGQSFSEYMRKNILLPLGMYHSSFSWSASFDPPVPNGHDLHGRPVPVYVYPDRASGGLFSTVEDIATFIAAGMPGFRQGTQQVLGEKSVKILYSPAVQISGFYGFAFEAYGSGYFIEKFSGGTWGISHGGQGTGWMSHFHSIPETGDGIVILTNSQRSWPLFAHILQDWAKWLGLASIGMGYIVWAELILWVILGIVIGSIAVLGIRITIENSIGMRRFFPFSKQDRFLRGVAACIACVLLVLLIWALNQQYLFITSLFPDLSQWFGWTILFIAIVMFFFAILPKYNEGQ